MFEKGLFIMDGATGTRLQAMGMPAGACSERWVLEHKDDFKAMQAGYVAAGSELLYAPTFGANRVNLSRHKIERSPESLCAELVELSRDAAGGKALVLGDMSPTGLVIEPYGDTEEEELLDIFLQQAWALEKAGVDAFGIETQMYMAEAKLSLQAVRQVSDRPAIVTFTCGPTGKTIWGEDLCDIVDELSPLGLDAFGINCVGDLDLVESLLRKLRAHTQLPLIAKPNAGMPQSVDGKQVYSLTPEEMGSHAQRFLDAGARLLGGCCGTDERHIAAIRQAVVKKTGAQ